MAKLTVTKGRACFQDDGVRCLEEYRGRVCNKLICKKNREGQVAGNFRCERCRQEIEVSCSAD